MEPAGHTGVDCSSNDCIVFRTLSRVCLKWTFGSLKGLSLSDPSMAAEKLRDLSQPIDVALLDATVNAFYGTGSKEEGVEKKGGSFERAAADHILRDLQNNPDMWLQVVLEGVIKYKWNALPTEERDGMKNYISDLIVKLSSDEATLRRERLYVNKLNIILVQILKHEWPARWKNFIPDLVAAARTSETICENCMAILKLLSEEVFDFSRGEMTQLKIKELKQSLNSEFQLIHELCLYVLSASQRTELIRATLATLHAFLSWIPLGYIFESPLLETLLKFFPLPAYRNLTLQCLTEVAALNFGDFYNVQYVKMYTIFMAQLQNILPPNTNIPEAYAHGNNDEQVIVRFVAWQVFFPLGREFEAKPLPIIGTWILRFTSLLNVSLHPGVWYLGKIWLGSLLILTSPPSLSLSLSLSQSHIRVLETSQETVNALLMGLEYLINISYVDDTEVFKVCLDYWNSLVLELYEAHHNADNPAMTASLMGLQVPMLPGMVDGLAAQLMQRRQLFAGPMSKLRLLMICRMAKPEEVLIVEDENGNIVRETMKDNDVLVQYKQVKLVMDSIIWAFRHTERNIAETGLLLLLEMLKNFQASEFCNQFYRTYFLTIEQEIFAVLTDTFHKPGFKLHVLVLQHLFCLVESGPLTEPLWDATVPYAYPNNAMFVREFTIKLLSSSFPNMTASEVTQFVSGLFESTNDPSVFKNHIRDFIAQSKEFSAQDNKDLYAEEAAAQRERDRQRMLSIPGLIAPNEIQDEMVDL
nr:protein EXPORTIN 1A isoform X2 [Ipomoea batatas]